VKAGHPDNQTTGRPVWLSGCPGVWLSAIFVKTYLTMHYLSSFQKRFCILCSFYHPHLASPIKGEEHWLPSLAPSPYTGREQGRAGVGGRVKIPQS